MCVCVWFVCVCVCVSGVCVCVCVGGVCVCVVPFHLSPVKSLTNQAAPSTVPTALLSPYGVYRPGRGCPDWGYPGSGCPGSGY